MWVVICKGWRVVYVVQLVVFLRCKFIFLYWVQLVNRVDVVNVVFFFLCYRFVGICLEIDLKFIGFNFISQVEKNLNVDYLFCGLYMQIFDCVFDLGFQLDGVIIYFCFDDVYKMGMVIFSNGGGMVIVLVSGVVFIYINGGDGQVYIIIVYGFDGKENKGFFDFGFGFELGLDLGLSFELQFDVKGVFVFVLGDLKKGDDKEDIGLFMLDMYVELLVVFIMFVVVCLLQRSIVLSYINFVGVI